MKLLFGALVVLSSFTQNYYVYAASIFPANDGKDHREAMITNESPWSSIGRITHFTKAQGPVKARLHICTGTLVGRRLMLTAAHCVEDSGKIVPVHFQLNYLSGTYTDEADSVSIAVGTFRPNKNYLGDWAIVLLDKDLGTAHGYMDFAPPSKITLPMQVIFAGYSNDFFSGEVAGIDHCNINTQFSNAFGHDCSMRPGASGGPLFINEDGHYYIVGINTREHSIKPFDQKYTEENSNLSVWSDALYNNLLSLTKGYE